jgi:hypothetical protein
VVNAFEKTSEVSCFLFRYIFLNISTILQVIIFCYVFLMDSLRLKNVLITEALVVNIRFEMLLSIDIGLMSFSIKKSLGKFF